MKTAVSGPGVQVSAEIPLLHQKIEDYFRRMKDTCLDRIERN